MKNAINGALLLALALSLGACGSSDGGNSTSTLAPALAVTTLSLAPATVGAAYNQILAATGATAWSVTAGTLPPGLALNANSISGTAAQSGIFDCTLTASNGTDTAARALSLTVYPQLQVLTDSLPLAVSGSGYGETILAYGGSGNYLWQVSAGSLPPGLTLGTSGTPAVGLAGTATTQGVFNFTVLVTDSLGNVASRALTLGVRSPLSILTGVIPQAVRGEYFSVPLFATGGNPGAFTWSISSGVLPAGLFISSNGSPFTLLSGVPTSSGAAAFTLAVTDANLNQATRALSVQVYDAGTILTAAGDGSTYLSGAPNGDGGLATLAKFNAPQGLAFDTSGNLYIGERNNYRVRRVDAITGIVSTFAGDGTQGAAGGPDSIFPAPSTRLAATAKFVGITDIKTDAQDNLWILDGDGNALHRVNTLTGIITTVAGTGVQGYSGDNGAAAAAQLSGCYAFALTAGGDTFIADTFNYRIRKISGGVITTAVGTGAPGSTGDGGLAVAAQIAFITGMCADSQGNVYFGGGSSGAPDIHSRVRKIDAAGFVTTVAGMGAQGFSGDGGQALAATFNRPASLCVDAQGNLYICDMRLSGGNNRVRKVDAATGVVTTIAGTGLVGFSGDGASAVLADIAGPFTPAVDTRGNLYFCDTANNRVRKVLKP